LALSGVDNDGPDAAKVLTMDEARRIARKAA
jgi:hypothetical protein